LSISNLKKRRKEWKKGKKKKTKTPLGLLPSSLGPFLFRARPNFSSPHTHCRSAEQGPLDSLRTLVLAAYMWGRAMGVVFSAMLAR
jgi:hypothetical protein